MNFTITTTIEPRYLRITATGKYVFGELFDFIRTVKAEAEKAQRDHVLIDCGGVSAQMIEAERFQGGQKIAEVFKDELTAALIMPRGEVTKLGQMVATNRGAKFFVSESESEALEWLLHE